MWVRAQSKPRRATSLVETSWSGTASIVDLLNAE
jgi:hypothetical protein